MKKLKPGMKIGLALSGGGALGAAHVGIIRALEENEINIDFISGTSIGALVAALYAFGVDIKDVKDIAMDMSWRDISKISLSKFGLFSNSKMEKFLDKTIGDVKFSESKIPLAIVTTNISTGKKVVLRKGKVADAVMASTSIPGIFKPVNINNKLLVDGGIVENVPVSPLKKMGAEYIIAVDLNAKHQYERPKNIVDVIMNSFHYTLASNAKLQSKNSDLLLKPNLGEFSRIKISQAESLIKKGYKEVLKVIEKKN